ncbi:MAG: hypothetical protein HQ582_31115 [Planctomycetes bacterium]|nr:hypothetical protein [Planctomycetota bacterium]
MTATKRPGCDPLQREIERVTTDLADYISASKDPDETYEQVKKRLDAEVRGVESCGRYWVDHWRRGERGWDSPPDKWVTPGTGG